MAQPLKDNDWKIDWDINPNDDDYIETEKRYTKVNNTVFHYISLYLAHIKIYNKTMQEIPSMKAYGNNQDQQSMFKVFTAGRKIDKPLLLYLVDSYTRSRIHFYKKNKSILSISKWLESNKQIQAITNNNKHNMDLLKSAIETFYRRINHPIQFQPREKIIDKIEPFALYIHDTIRFIEKLLDGQRDANSPTDKDNPNDPDRAIPPFQVHYI